MNVQAPDTVATAASSAAGAAVKVAPPLAISGLSVSHAIPLSDLVLYATLLYTVLQTTFLVWDRVKHRRTPRKARP